MTIGERSELVRHLTLEFGGRNSHLARGAPCVSSEFCAMGLECSKATMTCQPRLLPAEEACVDADSAKIQRCAFVVDLVNRALQMWLLVVTSSGGGGHLVAAKNLQKQLLQEVESGYDAAAAYLLENKDLLSPEACSLGAAALSAVQHGPPAVELLDLMKSPCASLDGWGHVALGEFMSNRWNELQSTGDIEGLRRLVAMQPVTQWIFGTQCRSFMKSLIDSKALGYGSLPQRLISTQPLLIKSLLEASAPAGLDLYMTDLPTEEAGVLLSLYWVAGVCLSALLCLGLPAFEGCCFAAK